MEYIRQWKVGDRTFGSKLEAQRYEAQLALDSFDTVDDMIGAADAVIALLRPFATKRPRKARDNGARKGTPRPGVRRTGDTLSDAAR